MERERELRMYFFVMYNLSPIQQGIQAGHCVVEYGQKYKNDELYAEFAAKFKTFILLNGGTSNDGWIQDTTHWGNCTYGGDDKLGTMEIHEKHLIENEINFAAFREPDANNALTALCFLCDEKVFDFEEYPTFEDWLDEKMMSDPTTEMNIDVLLPEWTEFVGGAKNAALKQLIYKKKLA